MRNLTITGVIVFLEKRKTRVRVGMLTKNADAFIFTYDDHYFNADHVIPLGPEFPLTQKEFISKHLFPFFEDRIPSRKNPAYPEYCLAMGIDPNEKNPLVLLSTIGRKGPSSFIFTPLFDRSLTGKDLLEFRNLLGLTSREFAEVFEFAQSTLNGLERNRIQGTEILKRLEIIVRFPNVALHLLTVNGGYLSHEKWVHAMNALKERSGEGSNL